MRWLPLLPLLLLFTSSSRGSQLNLGQTAGGAQVAFTRGAQGWGVSIHGSPRFELAATQPAQLLLSQDGQSAPQVLAASYDQVKLSPAGTAEASATVRGSSAVLFHVRDSWRLHDGVLELHRAVTVEGSAPGAGFASAIRFTAAAANWSDASLFAPGVLYADPTYDGERSPGGTLPFAAHQLGFREDILPAPMIGLRFKNGWSVAMLDPSPRGDTTEAESKLQATAMTDQRFQFGAFQISQAPGASLQFGFAYPGSVTGYFRGHGDSPVGIYRYHPVEPGFTQSYTVSLRVTASQSFPAFTRDSWRWAWNTLKPPIESIDILEVRQVLSDHLAAQVREINGHTGVPFVRSTVDDSYNWNWTMIAMGFVGKDLDCADALLQEGDRDSSPRGQHMRALGLAMIATMIQGLPTVPLQATGIDLTTGKPWDHIWLAPWLRNATEDMRVLLLAYRREQKLGRAHPEWLAWVRQYGDWLLAQQRADGSFPRRWEPASNVAAEPSGTASYNAVPVLVLLAQETGEPKYRAAAIRAADFTWTNYGSRGLFIGGASDNPNITDKEAGLLSLEAFLALYNDTHQRIWLERAEAAGDFAESWIWIWNLPMPADADNAQLHWKRGVSTVGLQGISALHAGGADEYLDCAVGLYAELYNSTHDPHYLEVTRVLLDDTKSMVALPGRLYDMRGPGWQQENFGLGPGPGGRGVGSHRLWLPWVSANHLHGINALEQYDPALFRKLTAEGKQAQ